MPRKVRIPTRNGDEEELEPLTGLSEDRLALVNRYMVEEETGPVQPPRLVRAEEAPEPTELPREPRITGNGAAPATPDRVVPVQPPRLVRVEEPPPEPTELPREALSNGHGATPPTHDEVVPVQPRRFWKPEERPATTEPPREPAAVVRAPEPRAAAEIDRRAGTETREPRAVAKADKQAAKEAARRMAALEKKEARERKALAKAAARRRSA